MSYALPDRLHRELDGLSIPDRDKKTNDQLARIQQLQIAHHLEFRDDRPKFVVDIWWPGLSRLGLQTSGSVSLVYSLFVARQFLVHCVYSGGRMRGRYDPAAITEARALGTRFDLTVAKHVFDFFLAESTLRWQRHVAETGSPRDIEHETQFIYGLWKDVVPDGDAHGHEYIPLHMDRLDAEARRRFAYPQAPFPHDAVKLSPRSASAHEAGRASQATLRPTTPSALQGGTA